MTAAARKMWIEEGNNVLRKDIGCGLVRTGGALLTTGNKSLAVVLTISGLTLCLKKSVNLASKDQLTNDGRAAH